MLRSIIVIALTVVSTQAFAWSTPKEAVEKFVQFDLDGGRLSSKGWAEYIKKYVYVPVGYDEPGWDTVVLVERFSVDDPECVLDKCTVTVTYQLAPTKSLIGPSVMSHEAGGTEILKFSVINKSGVWKIDPTPTYPRISLEKYKPF